MNQLPEDILQKKWLQAFQTKIFPQLKTKPINRNSAKKSLRKTLQNLKVKIFIFRLNKPNCLNKQRKN